MAAHEIGGGFGGGLERRVHGFLIFLVIPAISVIPREGGVSSTP